MADPFAALKSRIQKAPSDPGIYRWLDSDGAVLYVGKAKNLKKRLLSYVQKDQDAQGPWKRSLMQKVTDFDVTVASNELEALVLETNLIKELRPRYNVMMKDDKNYVYVRIDIEEAYPTLDVVRQVAQDKAKYFGPYLSSYDINRTLDLLHNVLAFRACRGSIDALNRGKIAPRACVESQIGQCNGLCTGKISQEQYRKSMEEVMRFLRGDRQGVVATLKTQMLEAAAEKKFERAGKLRDVLAVIDGMQERQVVSSPDGQNVDVIGVAFIANTISKGQVVVLRIRGGKLIDERSIGLSGEADTVAEALAQFLPQYYENEIDFPDTIVLGEEPEGKDAIAAWIALRRGKQIEIRVPERGKKSHLLTMAERNASQKIEQQFAKWETAAKNVEVALRELKEKLELPASPKRIECYDISHLGGTETVGAMSVMKNGKPANAEYRSFTIRTMKAGEIDDYKALREVLRRRLLHLVRNIKEEEAKWKNEGIVFGKAKKDEQEAITKIIETEGALSGEAIDYKTFLVARKDKEIISLARLIENTGGILEIKSVWTKPELRGRRIGQFIVRKILAGIKKGKVYVIFDPVPKLEEYYSEIGFRYLQTAPDVLQKKTEQFHKEHPEHPVGTIMVYIATEHKEDVSLKSHPDLLVIDGGKGQLGAVVEVLKELGLSIPVIGLAKREEEVFVPGSPVPVDFPKESQARYLLQRIRDEAHRFSNAHREKRLMSAAVGSALDALSGIGPKTKKDLLERFGSVPGIQAARDEELLTVVNAAQLKAIREGLSH